jgi:hypothetical protein
VGFVRILAIIARQNFGLFFDGPIAQHRPLIWNCGDIRAGNWCYRQMSASVGTERRTKYKLIRRLASSEMQWPFAEVADRPGVKGER